MRKIPLNGKWEYKTDPKRAGETNKWYNPSYKFKPSKKMAIPNNWEVAGLSNYSGAVWFKTEFDSVELRQKEDLLLRFNGVDYFAKVWLNGHFIGEHEGYFQPFEFNITQKIIKNGANTLVVEVFAPAESTGKDAWPHRKTQIKGVFSHHDVRPGSWSPKFGQEHGTGGIWNEVELNVIPKIRISKIKASPALKDNYKNSEVEVEVHVENSSSRQEDLGIDIKIFHHVEPASQDGELLLSPVSDKKIRAEIPPGRSVHKTKLEVKNPFLWWPWDHGEANLYVIDAELITPDDPALLQKISRRFGIREIKVGANKEWIINGRKVFVRGSNIIPEEYLSTYDSERIKKDIDLIKKSNCNAVRVHAHVNRKELYDALDEAGIMVWQDFPLQWDYSDSEIFAVEAIKQITDMVDLLHNNPSVVVWCCHNEPVSTGKKLDPRLFETVEREDKTRMILNSSDFHDHPYPGWFWGHYRYFLSLPGKPFPTEFGAQALPGVETLKKMFSKKDLWPPNWERWSYHNFVYEPTFQIAKIKTGKSIGEFSGNSQDYQAKAIKFAIENYRRSKWKEISGIFHFMLLEPWPAISYSVTDYFRNPKKGYRALSMAFQPVLVIASLRKNIFSIGSTVEGQFWIVNDHFKEFNNAKIVFSLQRGSKILKKFDQVPLDIYKDTCEEITNIVYNNTKGLLLAGRLKPGPCVLFMEVFDRDGRLLSSNEQELTLEKTPKNTEQFNAIFVWE